MAKMKAAMAAVLVMEREGVTHAFLVPSVLHMLTELPGVDRRDLSRMRMIAYGSSPITPTGSGCRNSTTRSRSWARATSRS